MNKIPLQIQVPTHSNENIEFPTEHHDIFITFLIDQFGGFSRWPGLVSGGWVHEGVVFPDTTIVFVVDVDGLIANGQKVRDMVDYTKTHYAQIKIRLSYLNVSEIL